MRFHVYSRVAIVSFMIMSKFVIATQCYCRSNLFIVFSESELVSEQQQCFGFFWPGRIFCCHPFHLW